MNMKATLDAAKASILAGNLPKRVTADNKKTGITILDNVPQLTCYGICPIRAKCYDVKLLKMRPTVMKARALRHYMIDLTPSTYVEMAKKEILASGYDKVRVYGGGDFAPSHVNILLDIMRALPKVTFYMISKTIRNYHFWATVLLDQPNFFLNLSECADYHFGEEWNDLKNHPRVNTVYTLLDDDMDLARARASDIVFNVSKAKANIALYKLNTLPLCPCDAKDIPSQDACDGCGLCATKGGVRGNL